MDDFILVRADSGEVVAKSENLCDLFPEVERNFTRDYIIRFGGKTVLTHTWRFGHVHDEHRQKAYRNRKNHHTVDTIHAGSTFARL